MKKRRREDESQFDTVTISDVLKSWKMRLREWFYSRDSVIAWMDIVNFFRFKREFNEEEEDFDSKFNKYHLRRNKFKNIIYVQWNFSDSDFMYSDYDANKMYMRKANEISKYLGVDMGWGEYLDVDISNFTDEDGEPTLSYVYIFRYYPKVFTFRRFFKRLGIFLGCVAVVIALAFGYYYLMIS